LPQIFSSGAKFGLLLIIIVLETINPSIVDDVPAGAGLHGVAGHHSEEAQLGPAGPLEAGFGGNLSALFSFPHSFTI
jgi:hypothetical protein